MCIVLTCFFSVNTQKNSFRNVRVTIRCPGLIVMIWVLWLDQEFNSRPLFMEVRVRLLKKLGEVLKWQWHLMLMEPNHSLPNRICTICWYSELYSQICTCLFKTNRDNLQYRSMSALMRAGFGSGHWTFACIPTFSRRFLPEHATTFPHRIPELHLD